MTQGENLQLQEEEFLEYLKTKKNTAAHPRQTEISEEQKNRLINAVKKRYDCGQYPALTGICMLLQGDLMLAAQETTLTNLTPTHLN